MPDVIAICKKILDSYQFIDPPAWPDASHQRRMRKWLKAIENTPATTIAEAQAKGMVHSLIQREELGDVIARDLAALPDADGRIAALRARRQDIATEDARLSAT